MFACESRASRGQESIDFKRPKGQKAARGQQAQSRRLRGFERQHHPEGDPCSQRWEERGSTAAGMLEFRNRGQNFDGGSPV